MKKLFSFVFLLVIGTLLIYVSKADAITRGFGGKVLSTGKQTNALITCASTYGPLTIFPIIAAPAGPYFISTPTGPGRPQTQKWSLGNYNPIPDMKTCYNTETGAPVPAYKITTYGFSR